MYTAVITLWGVWRSFNALKAKSEADKVRCLRYWVVYGCFAFYDAYVDWLVTWVPGHALAKHGAALAAFLLPPSAGVTDYVFSYAVLPLAYLARLGAERGLFLVLAFGHDVVTHHERRRSERRLSRRLEKAEVDGVALVGVEARG